MLSDACFDLCLATQGNPSVAEIAEAVADLRADIDRYSKYPFRYDETELKLLRYAAAVFEEGGINLETFRAIATSVTEYFDCYECPMSFLEYVMKHSGELIDQAWIDRMLAWQEKAAADSAPRPTKATKSDLSDTKSGETP